MVVKETETDVSLEKTEIPKEVAILPSGSEVIYPAMLSPLVSSDERTIRIIDEVTSANTMAGVFPLISPDKEATPDNLNEIGTVASVVKLLKMPDGSIRALIQGISRIRLLEITQTEPYLKGTVDVATETVDKTPQLEALTRNLRNLFSRIVSLAPNLTDEIAGMASNITEPGNLADMVAAHINLTPEEKRQILGELDVRNRMEILSGMINRELEILELGHSIQSKIKDQMDKTQRDFYLREQLKAIQQELGETDTQTTEINEISKRIEEAQLPPEVLKEAERELERLSKMPPQAADYSGIRTYLDWLVTLPWNKSQEEPIDIQRASEILDEDHYDLEKVKERILDYLAVRMLKQDMKGPILCFVGPPGTGKTSIGRSIARALGRRFVRISLGGIRDEA